MDLLNSINKVRDIRGEIKLDFEFSPIFYNYLKAKDISKFFKFMSLQSIFRYISFLKLNILVEVIDKKEKEFIKRINSIFEKELNSFYKLDIIDVDFLWLMQINGFKNDKILKSHNSLNNDSVYSILFDLYFDDILLFKKYSKFFSILDLLVFFKDFNLYNFVLEMFKISENPDFLFTGIDDVESFINKISDINSISYIKDEISLINMLKFEFYAMRRGHYKNLDIPDAKSIMSIIVDFEKYSDVLIPNTLYS
ncbi:MAG: hypothetical protein M0R46_04845 [Candidatus Muirbacterium halophilum]|nr:hypothetical protein [Candidatus Muirbacterium halophilum]MCK9475224.1 hypothetical protein [Candidatus Muirbacterium halophilum]